MASDTENKKLNDLRVVDLRSELEKRDLDKTGIKAVLIERLQKVSQEVMIFLLDWCLLVLLMHTEYPWQLLHYALVYLSNECPR